MAAALEARGAEEEGPQGPGSPGEPVLSPVGQWGPLPAAPVAVQTLFKEAQRATG